MKRVDELGVSRGPWELMDDGATVVTKQDEGVYGEVCYCRESCDGRLISAAPELYEALADMMVLVLSDAVSFAEFKLGTIAKAKQALAKAAGEEAK